MADKAMTKQEAAKAAVVERVKFSKDLIERMGLTQDQFLRCALNALIAQPQIVDCTPASIRFAVMKSAEAGLLPDGKQAAIVPFNSKGGKVATLIPMIEGRIKLARQATPGLSLRVRAVYDSDEFEYSEGLQAVLRHRPKSGPRGDNDLVAVYAVALSPNQPEPEFEVMFKGTVDQYKARSKSKTGPWLTDYAEMAKKTVLGQLLKRLPKSSAAAGLPDVEDGTDDIESYMTEMQISESPAPAPSQDQPKPRGRPRKQVANEAPTPAPAPEPAEEVVEEAVEVEVEQHPIDAADESPAPSSGAAPW